ncbi:MAG: hypothetical protein DHS20C15_24430 [Planctomycetota bacterium]|nr:MAG: hypothetical protein DHS20C15_24430 [Planctomycetota bacterium]
MSMNRKNQQGFTLVELLIVVIILGILAAVVIPQFNSAANESREAAVTSNLATIRQAIEMYKVQHNDELPGNATGVTLEQALTQTTDLAGAVVANNAGPFGPYLRNSFPASPVDGVNTVTSAATTTAATGETTGWMYNTATGEFRCHTTDLAASGVAYNTL